MRLHSDFPIIEGPYCPIEFDGPLAITDNISRSWGQTFADSLSSLFQSPPSTQTTAYDIPSLSKDLPPNWQEGFFNFRNDKLIPYYLSRSRNEKAVVPCISGLKPDHPVSKKLVNAYNKRGVSVVWINLPNTLRGKVNVQEYEDIILDFAISETSPLQTEFSPLLPRFIQAHSTGAALLTKLLTDPAIKDQFIKFKAAIIESGFFDNVNETGIRGAFKRGAFALYAKMHRDDLSYETYGGLMYLHLKALRHLTQNYRPLPDASKLSRLSFQAALILHAGVQTVRCKIDTKNNIYIRPSYLTPRGSPTFGQMQDVVKATRRIKNNILKSADVSSPIPVLFVAGSEDDFSALKPMEQIASKLNSAFILVSGGHKPLSQKSKKARKAVFKIMRELVPEITKQPKVKLVEETEYWPPVEPTISVRPSLTARFTKFAIRLMPPPLLRLGARHTLSESAHTPS